MRKNKTIKDIASKKKDRLWITANSYEDFLIMLIDRKDRQEKRFNGSNNY